MCAVKRIKLPPQTNWNLLANWHKDKDNQYNYDDQLYRYGAKVSRDAKSSGPCPHAMALLHYLTPEVSNAIGANVYPSYSFGWEFHNQSYFNPHIDTRELGLYCGIMVEQDAPWTLDLWDIDGMQRWTEIPTEVGTALIFDGRNIPHKRPTYQGKSAVSMIFSYQYTEQEVQWTRDYLNITDSSTNLSSLLHDLNLKEDDFRCAQRATAQKPIAILDVPLPEQDYQGMIERVLNMLWNNIPYSASEPKTDAEVLQGPMMVEAIELRNSFKEYLNMDRNRELTSGNQVITTIPEAYMFQSIEHDTVIKEHPFNDYSIYCPMDPISAQYWGMRINHSNELVYCNFGQGIMVRGYPTEIEIIGTNNGARGRWISVSFREICNSVLGV